MGTPGCIVMCQVNTSGHIVMLLQGLVGACWEGLSKSIHFSCVVCTRAIGMDDPILVPFCERAVVHFQVVHLLGGGEFCFNGNKVFFKAFLKLAHVRKLGGDCFIAICWRSCAHSPAGVSSLK